MTRLEPARSEEVRCGQPRSLGELIERRDAFLRDGVPSEFIEAQIAEARRRRNREMAHAARALAGLAKTWLLRLRWRAGQPAARRHA